MTDKNINLVCPINSLGYGITSYNIFTNLLKIIDVTLFPIGNIELENHWDKELLIAKISKQRQYSKNDPCLKIWHPHDLLMKPHGGGTYFTYSFFETNKISANDRIGYDISDHIITPTKWAKNILIDNGISANKISVIPPGIDLEIFDYQLNINTEDMSHDDYVFVNIGKWEIRKGHDILVHAFNQAFSETDNVRLLMINTNPFLSEKENKQWQNLYKNSKLSNKIYMMPRLSSQLDVAKAMSISDCGVFPARAEGWNNEAIEMMAMNKPIIITNCSGHTEYVNNQNSYLIDVHDMETADDGKFFNGNSGDWYKLDSHAIEQTITHMRHVYNNHIKINTDGLNTAREFSWLKTSQSIVNIL